MVGEDARRRAVRAREGDETDGVVPGRLDSSDARILQLLAQDARQSARAIAREVGMSPGAVSERIDRLERTGVIRGYHAALDPAAMGFPMEIIVGLQIQQGLPLQDLVARVLEIPEVVAVHVVTGQWDLVVTLRARDQRHLHELIIGRLWEVPGFRHSESMLVLETSERSGAWFGGTSVPHEAEQGARGASPRQAKPSPKR